MTCRWDGCSEPKGAGKGRQYCDSHRGNARRRRRADAVIRMREWGRRNRERKNLVCRVQRYELSADEFLALLEFQDGCCAICRVLGGLSLEVDHDHKTNAVRGLLCGDCNVMLGRARDRMHVLDAASSYLAHPMWVQFGELAEAA